MVEKLRTEILTGSNLREFGTIYLDLVPFVVRRRVTWSFLRSFCLYGCNLGQREVD